MGILNVTPDSFSDGGRWADPDAAIERGLEMIAQGADMIDVGGESTRPGATRISAETELDRVLPVVQALADQTVVSIDTTRAMVALRAVSAGARIVNDVSGGLADELMASTVAELGVPYICMFNTGPAAVRDMDAAQIRSAPDVVRAGLAERLNALTHAGMLREQVIVDPGLGFAFAGAPNWEILAGLPELAELGRPILIGASRKRFLNSAIPADHPDLAARDAATAAVTTLAAAAGVWAVRVHSIPENRVAINVATDLGGRAMYNVATTSTAAVKAKEA